METEPEKKFLVLPSLMAGICLGFNNFMLGLISDLGVNAAYIFSLGALIYTIGIKFYQIIRLK